LSAYVFILSLANLSFNSAIKILFCCSIDNLIDFAGKREVLQFMKINSAGVLFVDECGVLRYDLKNAFYSALQSVLLLIADLITFFKFLLKFST
jgi:hypothetical protein